MTAPDTPVRRFLAFVLLWLHFKIGGRIVTLLAEDHPTRQFVESTEMVVFERLRQHPRLGCLPLGMPASKPRMSRITKLLWVGIAAVLLSDLLSVGPLDLGLIPDIHPIASLFGLHHAATTVPHIFQYRLPWHDLYGRFHLGL